ncbi:hypothetical protein [Clostridium coskatii]|uniref:Uncharacterized protein n=1 Tax=Clostridium coskatii TaxID=1705578 RepID=A0A166RD21_9CLOT|nr:hypothetical protein [Clostridium coskatii]OAA90697.1 hypothetical protein WX73_02062 [Clostridium coskatii]OBR97467.1 hypothetical protein CLCOS_03230 [Clostridium coskatii]
MNTMIVNSIIIPVVGAGIGTILEIGRRQLKGYLDSKQDLIQKQQEAIKQSMGIELYNKDKQVVQEAVKTVEQLGKEFDWDGTLKHSKVLEFVAGKTGLSDTEIYNTIKATVLEVNKYKTVQK